MKTLGAYLAALVAAVLVLGVGGYFTCLANDNAVVMVLMGLVTVVASVFVAVKVARGLLPKVPPWP